MSNSYVDRLMENIVKNAFNDMDTRLTKSVKWLASMQGGETTIQNYKLLGKRVLIVAGVVIVVQAASSAIGTVLSRKREERRIEQVVRRVLEEERQKAEAEAQA